MVTDDVTWPQRYFEAVRSAILATAWLLVITSDSLNLYDFEHIGSNCFKNVFVKLCKWNIMTLSLKLIKKINSLWVQKWVFTVVLHMKESRDWIGIKFRIQIAAVQLSRTKWSYLNPTKYAVFICVTQTVGENVSTWIDWRWDEIALWSLCVCRKMWMARNWRARSQDSKDWWRIWVKSQVDSWTRDVTGWLLSTVLSPSSHTLKQQKMYKCVCDPVLT